jgi:uncharacterized protein YjiS (DUF1127 family)
LIADEDDQMPANDQKHGLQTTLTRLLRRVTGWRRRRAARRHAQLHGLMHMSDRMLADIGVRRADVHAAINGLMPVEHIARTRGGSPWTAQIHALRPQARERSEANDTDDLGAAA